MIFAALVAATAASSLWSTNTINIGYVSHALITVLVDNDCNPTRRSLECPWGLSIYVQTPRLTILFDTGPSPQALTHNMRMLNISMSSIDVVVLSHEHMDHVGGLPALKPIAQHIVLYIPQGFPSYLLRWIRSMGFQPIIVSHTIVIARGIAIVGPLYGPPNEIALLLNVRGFGAVLITGCSHPGIVNFVKYAERTLHVHIVMVLGGFHTFYLSESRVQAIVKQLINLGVKFIAPLHCSGSVMRHVLKEYYPRNFVELYVGQSLYLDP